jgi:aspartyl-tRNA(Asn)/glutamyl-tRNA(Gln) amidotransferase subunit C
LFFAVTLPAQYGLYLLSSLVVDRVPIGLYHGPTNIPTPEVKSMTKLNVAQVKNIAELAKLTLSDDEARTFQEQLSNILNYAEILQQIDTTDIPPTASAIPLKNVMRADEVALSLTNEDALANAPAAEAGSFKVKAVLD